MAADGDNTMNVTISRVTIQSVEGKQVLVQTCRQSHLSVCLSVCRSVGLSEGCTVAKRLIGCGRRLGGERVGRGMGVLNGGGDCRRGRGSFGSKCGASHCNQWGIVA